jgi:hypothetical protein
LVVVEHFMAQPLEIVRHDETLEDVMGQKTKSKKVRAPQPQLMP